MKKIIIVIATIAMLLMIVACKKQPIEPVDEIMTEDGSFEMAKSIVETSIEYEDYNGRNLEHVETTSAGCPSCWLFKFRFTMDGMEDSQIITMADFTVNIQNGEMQEVRKTFTPKACTTNEECVEDSTLVGVQWLCEDSVCKRKPFGNPASMKCEEDGGTLHIMENEDGQYGLCVFDDGSACEEWAYFRGECEQGEKFVSIDPIE